MSFARRLLLCSALASVLALAAGGAFAGGHYWPDPLPAWVKIPIQDLAQVRQINSTGAEVRGVHWTLKSRWGHFALTKPTPRLASMVVKG